MEKLLLLLFIPMFGYSQNFKTDTIRGILLVGDTSWHTVSNGFERNGNLGTS